GSWPRTRTCSRTGSRPPAASAPWTPTGCGTPAPRTRAGAASAPRRRSPCPGTRATGTSVSSLASPSCLRLPIHFEHREESLLRHLDGSDLFHTALALFLFLEQLALARDVATVALRGDVLA